jgi:HlyD family secretion protein
MTTKKKTRPLPIIILVLALAAVAVIVIVILAGRGGNGVPDIEAYTVTADTLDREVSANGVIGARDTETLVAQVGGAVVRLGAKKGERVEKGRLIVLLDQEKILVQQKEAAAGLATTRRGIRVELLRLRSGFLQARAEAEQADRDFATAKELFASGSVSESEYLRATDRRTVAANNLLAARQNLNLREGRLKDDPQTAVPPPDDSIVANSEEVRQAQAQLESIGTTLRLTEIRSTLSGVVTELPVEVGSVAAPGLKVAVIADPRFMEVSSNIDEVDIGYLTLGQEARIESDVFLNKVIKGRVAEIAPSITKVGDARVCEITIGFADPDRLAKIGASCSIYINVAHREHVPAVPLELYLQEGKKKFAFKIEADQAGGFVLRKTELATDVLGLDKIEVTGGIAVGDRIARGALKSFRDGMKVKLLPEKSPSPTPASGGGKP